MKLEIHDQDLHGEISCIDLVTILLTSPNVSLSKDQEVGTKSMADKDNVAVSSL